MDYPAPMDYREIPVESLLLDPMNPRHGDEVEGQEEVINAFLQDRTKSQQLLQLAKDIAENGPSPIDLALVVPEDGVYTVVEGNRRVLAMKLLKNPALARGSRIEKAIQEARAARPAPPPRHATAVSRRGCPWLLLSPVGDRWCQAGSRPGTA
jgi:hypothetical protein